MNSLLYRLYFGDYSGISISPSEECKKLSDKFYGCLEQVHKTMGLKVADQIWEAAADLTTQEQIEAFRSGILFGFQLSLELSANSDTN